MLARSRSLVKLKERIPLTLTESQLENVEITWEQWGDPKLPDERTIVILPSFSHSSHAASNRDDPSPGWWEGIIGPGKALNTSIFRVICGSVLGSPFGGTCPTSVHAKSGKRYNADFPQITPADMAYCHGKVLDALNVNKVHAIIGGSMGGMQVLEFAAQFPKRMDRFVAISCTAKTTPGTVAFRRVQRRAILADAKYKDGNYDVHDGPMEGMKIARELGMTCYRSREEFDSRFNWKPTGPAHFKSLTFDVESYMEYQANKFARVFDPNCYLLLSKAMDLTDVGRGFPSLADGLRRIEAESLIIGVQQDLLTPLSEQICIHDILKSFGRKSTLEIINSKFGHDSMFHPEMQSSTFGPKIQNFIEKGLEKLIQPEHQRYSSL